MGDKVIVKLTHPVTHNGEVITPPAEITLDKKQALKIVRFGCGIIISEIDDDSHYKDEDPDEGKDSDEDEHSDEGKDSDEDEHSDEGKDSDEDEHSGSGSLSDIVPVIEPKDMTNEELEAELTAAGIEIREGASRNVLIARVKKLRKEASDDQSVS